MNIYILQSRIDAGKWETETVFLDEDGGLDEAKHYRYEGKCYYPNREFRIVGGNVEEIS